MGREGHYIIAPKRLDEDQNSLKSVLERERERYYHQRCIYTKWRALYVNLEYEYICFMHRNMG